MNNAEYDIYQQYLEGKISKQELRSKLQDFSDQDFEDMVEGLGMLESSEEFSSTMADLEKRIDERLGQEIQHKPQLEKVKNSRGFSIQWLAAAVLIFIIGTLIFRNLYQPVTPERIFTTYYTPLEHPDPVFRSDDNNSLEQNAVAAYAAGHYELAVEYYEELNRKESWEIKNALFLGIAYISIDSEEKAIRTFNNLPSDLGSYKDEVTWYLSLAHIKNEDLVSARLLLEKLANEENYYQEQAKSILKKLK